MGSGCDRGSASESRLSERDADSGRGAFADAGSESSAEKGAYADAAADAEAGGGDDEDIASSARQWAD